IPARIASNNRHAQTWLKHGTNLLECGASGLEFHPAADSWLLRTIRANGDDGKSRCGERERNVERGHRRNVRTHWILPSHTSAQRSQIPTSVTTGISGKSRIRFDTMPSHRHSFTMSPMAKSSKSRKRGWDSVFTEPPPHARSTAS